MKLPNHGAFGIKNGHENVDLKLKTENTEFFTFSAAILDTICNFKKLHSRHKIANGLIEIQTDDQGYNIV